MAALDDAIILLLTEAFHAGYLAGTAETVVPSGRSQATVIAAEWSRFVEHTGIRGRVREPRRGDVK